jgi:hypothetical protein
VSNELENSDGTFRVEAGRVTVFAVSSGSYSDYHIEAVFSTREKAERYIELFGSTGYDESGIEEWELDPHEKEMREGIRAYSISMATDGEVDSIYLTGVPSGEPSFARYPGGFYGTIHARDEEHAVKIANERRLMLIAAADTAPRPPAKQP